MYKVESYVALKPHEAFHEHLYCNPGDYAMDGMWRIDNVDQGTGDLSSVQFDASYGDDVEPNKWHFRGQNNATGRAQLHLWITCLGGKLQETLGHEHNLIFSKRFNDTHPGLASGGSEFDHAHACGPDEIAVAPGFNFTKGSGRIFRSWPTSTFQGWHWAFNEVNGPADLTVYIRCLSKYSSYAGTPLHRHSLTYHWVPGPENFGQEALLPLGVSETRLSCGETEKGLVGGFWINDPFHVWWVGMEPQIKSRDFHWWNKGGGDNRAYMGLLCFDDRDPDPEYAEENSGSTPGGGSEETTSGSTTPTSGGSSANEGSSANPSATSTTRHRPNRKHRPRRHRWHRHSRHS
jgi:hypothetical protein